MKCQRQNFVSSEVRQLPSGNWLISEKSVSPPETVAFVLAVKMSSQGASSLSSPIHQAFSQFGSWGDYRKALAG